jgi:hypothetical protein
MLACTKTSAVGICSPSDMGCKIYPMLASVEEDNVDHIITQCLYAREVWLGCLLQAELQNLNWAALLKS